MSCPVCGAWTTRDPETGYDGSDICPSCGAEGWIETMVDGHMTILNERDEEIERNDAIR